MRSFLLLCLLVPVLGFSQTKNLSSVQRSFPKVDKVLEYEKALSAHAKKYHTGDAKWRVFEISSGPDAGGYQIVEGPFNWAGLDARGNLGTEHNNDYNKSVTPFLAQESQSGYYEYQESLSTVAMGDYSNKIAISHWYPKPGQGPQLRALIEKMKKVWEDQKTSVAVYMASSSGPTQYTLVTRYKNGFKDRDMPAGFIDAYNKIHGANSYDEFLKVIQNSMEKGWSELLEMRPELGSK